jgi:hypothetical protein
MASFKRYCDEIHDELDYFGRWFPTDTPVTVGDYGTMEGKKFNPLGNLRDLGIIVTATEDAGIGDRIFHASKSGVDVRSSAAVKVEEKGSIEVNISFTQKDAVVFIAQDITYATMNNLPRLGEAIHKLHKDNRWKTSYVFVSKRVIARRFFVAIADSSSCGVTLSGVAKKVIKGVGDIDLTVLDYKSSRGAVTKFDHGSDAVRTPLFELYDWKNPLFGAPYVTSYK